MRNRHRYATQAVATLPLPFFCRKPVTMWSWNHRHRCVSRADATLPFPLLCLRLAMLYRWNHQRYMSAGHCCTVLTSLLVDGHALPLESPKPPCVTLEVATLPSHFPRIGHVVGLESRTVCVSRPLLHCPCFSAGRRRAVRLESPALRGVSGQILRSP